MNNPLPQRQKQRKLTQQTKVRTEAQRVRRRLRRAKRRMIQNSGVVSTNNAYPLPIGADTGLQRIQRIKLSQGEKLSHQGISFLKCAFAPPDFIANDVAGVPDDFQGTSLVKKHRLITSYVVSASLDTYFLLAPMPGVSFFVATTAVGAGINPASIFQAVNYSDFSTMFGTSATTAGVVDKFRFVSNHIEIVPTVNQMSWTGNIQAWKIPITLTTRQAAGAGPGDIYSINGLQSCNATNANQYTGPFNLGLYCGAYNANAKFDFQPILEGIGAVPSAVQAGIDFGQLFSVAGAALTGLDNEFESIVIKVSGVGTNVLNSCIIKTWACVEYQCLPGNLLYEFSSLSPCDRLALDVYRKVINGLPVGVNFTQNESFWQRVLKIIRTVAGPLSAIPGPYGGIAGGVNAITSGLESVLF